jgi:hypothetical protein|tara:strand:+ start:597 stop:821 length:225 start_codon:yes stop_codon:yes gene_type:complete
MEIIGHTIGFWSGMIGAIFIILHMPTCNKHWAQKLPFISRPLAKHHTLTLTLATLFGFIHIILGIIHLIGGVAI